MIMPTPGLINIRERLLPTKAVRAGVAAVLAILFFTAAPTDKAEENTQDIPSDQTNTVEYTESAELPKKTNNPETLTETTPALDSVEETTAKSDTEEVDALETTRDTQKETKTTPIETDAEETIAIAETVAKIPENTSPETESRSAETTEQETKSPEELRTEYIASCQTLKYDVIMQDPDTVEGSRVIVEGTVTESWKLWFGFGDAAFHVNDGENIWYITYPGDDEREIDVNDQITVYGECDGTTTYSENGERHPIPKVIAEYFDLIPAPETEETESDITKPESTPETDTETVSVVQFPPETIPDTQETTAPVTTIPETVPPPADVPQETASTITYVLNTNSKKIHYEWCSSADDISAHNRATTTDYDGAIASGYVPCKRCDP